MSRSFVLVSTVLLCQLVGCGSGHTGAVVPTGSTEESVQSVWVTSRTDPGRPRATVHRAVTDPAAIGEALDVSAVQFRQHVRGSGLVLVKFGAPWCDPCRRVDAELDRVAVANDGQVTVLRVDVDDEPGLAQRYGVESIPRLFLLQDGKKIGDWTGFRQAYELQQAINESTTSVQHGEIQSNPFAI